MFNKDCKLGNPAKSRNQWKNILTTYQSKWYFLAICFEIFVQVLVVFFFEVFWASFNNPLKEVL
jgi:hypothetical protein